jgi:hypothetical protein
MDDKTQVTQVVEAAQKLRDDELRQVLEILGDELKHRYKRADQLAAIELKDAYWVETTLSGKKLPLGAKGHIVEIRREHITVHFSDYGLFTVSAKMLRKIDAPPGSPPRHGEEGGHHSFLENRPKRLEGGR